MAESPGRARGRPGPAGWALISLAAIYAAMLLVGPLLAIVWGALEHGVLAFLERLQTPDAIHALWLTCSIATVATLVNLCFGVVLALVIAGDEFRGRRVLNALVDVPFAVSPVITGFVVILLFGRGGWLEPLTEALGLEVVFAYPGMLLVTIFVSLPFVAREVAPVLEHLGSDQQNAARSLGASAWQVFWRVTLPSIRPAVLYGTSLCFARAIGEFGAVLVVSGSVSGLTETATLFIFSALDERDAASAHAMALVLAGLSCGLILGIKTLQGAGRETGAP